MLKEIVNMSPDELQREISRLNKSIDNGEENIIDLGRKLYVFQKYISNFWDSIKEEIYDEYDKSYCKEELIRNGVTLRQTSRFDEKSVDDGELEILKSNYKDRLDLIKKSTKIYQETGSRLTTEDGEVIPVGAYGKSSKSISFKI